MTTPDRKPGAAWDLVEDLLAEDEVERDMKLPAEERREAMKKEGLDPDRAHAIADEVLGKLGLATTATTSGPGPATASTTTPATPSNVASLGAAREKRRARSPVMLLLVAAAAAVVLALGGRAVVVALNTPSPSATPTSPVPSVPTALPGPSPEELAQRENRAQAEELRKTARAQCDHEKWEDCGKSLGAAAQLDPEGDRSRSLQRLEAKAYHGILVEEISAKLFGQPRRRLLQDKESVDGRKALLGPSKDQALALACADDGETKAFCTQLVAALKASGWLVTRTSFKATAADAGGPHGMQVDVATDASDATQSAADALTNALAHEGYFARGPEDLAPGGDALRLTVYPQ